MTSMKTLLVHVEAVSRCFSPSMQSFFTFYPTCLYYSSFIGDLIILQLWSREQKHALILILFIPLSSLPSVIICLLSLPFSPLLLFSLWRVSSCSYLVGARCGLHGDENQQSRVRSGTQTWWNVRSYKDVAVQPRMSGLNLCGNEYSI